MQKALALAGITVLVSSGLVATITSASAAPRSSSPALTGPALRAAADTVLQQNLAAVRRSAKDGFAVYSSRTDTAGRGAVRYTRTYNGLRVYGGDFIVRTEADGDFSGSSVGLLAPLDIDTTPGYASAKARLAATRSFKGRLTATGEPELFVDASSGTGRLAWETVVTGWAPDGQTPSRLHVIVDAQTGASIGAFDEIEQVVGAGRGVYAGSVAVDSTKSGSMYNLVDPVHGNGRTCDMNNGNAICTTFTDADNAWGNGANGDRQSAAVDAHYGAAKTFDYFTNVHGRNGIFGDGTGVPSRVHYGSNYVNAFWDGEQMTYGDGAGNARPLVALDVAGHEMSHGVTENVVPGGLTYSGESGGLNEGTSDIFGTMVEFYANNTVDPGDYTLGEKIDIFGNGKPARYMYDPPLDGKSHGCWSGATAAVDVHASSGVANHFFFDLAEGSGETAFGTSPLCGAALPVTGIGRAKAEKIWFRALDTYFVSNTHYVNAAAPGNTARAYTLSATADLYGRCGTEYRAVQAAWTAVNVAGPDDNSCIANRFSLGAAAADLTLGQGETVATTVSTSVVAGTAEAVRFSAVGVPAGVTVSVAPPVVTAGGSAKVTVTAGGPVGSGRYPIALVGTSPSMRQSVPVDLTVNGPPGCAGRNETAFPIFDNYTIESTIGITGCPAKPSATSTVTVDITHTFVGDLVVTLVAPDGTGYVLHNLEGGTDDDIKRNFTVNLSSEVANGAWRLLVQDVTTLDSGRLNRWALTL